MLYIVKRDITTFPGYICHQCNCVSKGTKGLAKKLFDKYPWANTYGEFRQFGTVDIKYPPAYPSSDTGPIIVNMYSQYMPGNNEKKGFDRHEAFLRCLEIIDSEFKGEELAFPYKVGCGLAGGDWEGFYKPVLEAFSIGRKIVICQYKEE